MSKAPIHVVTDAREHRLPDVDQVPLWATRLPVAFIVLTLIALLLVPILSRRQTEQLRIEIEQIATPARDLVDDIELTLAREVSAIRGYLLTQHEPFRDLFHESRTAAQQSEETLRPLADRLGPEVAARLNELRIAKDRWLAPNLDLLDGRLAPEAFIERILVQQDRYEATIRAARRLKSEITRVVDQRRQENRDADQLGVFVAAVLAVLALVSVLLVLWFSLRLRMLARRLRDRAQQEEALRRLAEAATRSRDEMLAIVSHDLRSPLTAISIGVSLLEGSVSTQQKEEHLAIIKRSIKWMQDLIQDLLDVARIEAGQPLTLARCRVEVPDLLGAVCEAFQAQAKEKFQQLDCHAPPGILPVHADRKRLFQVLSNLVGNAIKFTPEGGQVHLRANQQEGTILFAVSDTGIGIADEDLVSIFDPYWQTARTAHLGAGLGLPITKGIVEAHGGRIWAESEPGTGSTFYFTLPTAGAEAP